mmetsp:Transcript_9195/g.20488  ORF Transcript_9195/g.20488 Transcript_9195/m.20488 type:complete len:604 (-) Transcript_9195:58-1869(-)|eukprot:CAMPEP_0178378290 /NCGR_PEP_ID=MMETSP0689_2-20121128/4352_1 /TAXON_ID=160604 /ORGANISM="Amphidinium massartii, Strain CS-259" /LENGTH=603 /DNA_ID=CAMNT_0019998359 /DNA_START=27 /DNA_END=1838 /DNA_ORIENTATION=-
MQLFQAVAGTEMLDRLTAVRDTGVEWATAAQAEAMRVAVMAHSGAGQVSVAAQASAAQVVAAARSAVSQDSSAGEPAEIGFSTGAPLAWGDAPSGQQTKPPMRFRMVSADHLAHRSMQLEWDNGSGERQKWSSYLDPLSGWWEAEKVLPASATNVCVRFNVHILTKSYSISKNYRNPRSRPPGKQAEDAELEEEQEEVWFLGGQGQDSGAVDAVFELAGLPSECKVCRAWNTARGEIAIPEEWEHWPEESSRPRAKPPLAVLEAADSACSPAQTFRRDAERPLQHCADTTRRLIAAVKVLQDVRRQVCSQLRSMDDKMTGQWAAVNSTNTLSAGLAVAGAAALFVAPPVGIGLGIGSAVSGGAASAGDAAADSFLLAELRKIIIVSDMSSLAVAELQREWLQARDRASEALRSGCQTCEGFNLKELGLYTTQGMQVGVAIAHTAVNIADQVVLGGAAAAETASIGVRAMPVAAKALGVVGAVISTGVAVHGWVSTKSLQETCRGRMTDMKSAMLGTQRWLAAMSELECSICLGGIDLKEEARCCLQSWHYAHAKCLADWERECQANHRPATCPTCCGRLCSRAGVLEELIVEELQRHISDAQQ